jgi:hypothetical protein
MKTADKPENKPKESESVSMTDTKMIPKEIITVWHPDMGNVSGSSMKEINKKILKFKLNK